MCQPLAGIDTIRRRHGKEGDLPPARLPPPALVFDAPDKLSRILNREPKAR
jgi:hypothetical protein